MDSSYAMQVYVGVAFFLVASIIITWNIFKFSGAWPMWLAIVASAISSALFSWACFVASVTGGILPYIGAWLFILYLAVCVGAFVQEMLGRRKIPD